MAHVWYGTIQPGNQVLKVAPAAVRDGTPGNSMSALINHHDDKIKLGDSASWATGSCSCWHMTAATAIAKEQPTT